MTDQAPSLPWADLLPGLSTTSFDRLRSVTRRDLPKDSVLFRPGETAQGFAVVLSGRVEVHLTGPSGREILLYAVEPGQSCIQTTLGLLGDAPYGGEAMTVTPVSLAMIPRSLFLDMMDREPAFRGFVMASFARRMQDITRLLERVAFGRIEARLAAELLTMAQNGSVTATHAELAARIGSAREVVTRRLDSFQRAGWVEVERGSIHVQDISALRQLAATLG
jgi:CRP/FNR family transcriptional regulator